MSVSKYRIIQSTIDKQIDIPIEMKWDFGGKSDSVDEYQKTVLQEIIGSANDFEISRFEHQTYNILNVVRSSINYEFYFYDGNPANISTATIADYNNSYLSANFTAPEIYYYTKPFTKSFFKLDFYDTQDPTTQKNYFTIILPVQQGFTETASISTTLGPVDIKKPRMRLDYIGDKEGFFIYWLRSREYIDITQFYMSAKFFNGKTGNFTTMINTPQFQLPSPYTFNGDNYFYFKTLLDYNNKSYRVVKPNNNFLRFGTAINPMRWYEYVNPV